MKAKKSEVTVAVIQASPVLFDKGASVEKACSLIRSTQDKHPNIVLFPEAFIPAYPRGLGFGTVVGRRSGEGRDLWKRYYDNSIEVPGKETVILGEAARKQRVYTAIGVIERGKTADKGTLYCTLLYFGPDGSLLGKHRKLKPTGAERLVWGEGDGSTLTVIETEFGNIGGLICWENYMPLARTALYNKGVDLYLAPTADSRDTWQSTMVHIALEGRCFVLGCNQFVTKQMYPDDLKDNQELADQPEIMCRGGSVIISPFGKVLSGPLFDREGVLYAELDPGEVARSRFDFDVAGHYSRPDVFQLTVNEKPLRSVITER